MRKAITTRYAGPTNTRGSRIIASAAKVRVTMPYCHKYDDTRNHLEAARMLASKLGWHARFVGGRTDNGDCVFTSYIDSDCIFDS
jgi:hypothetical protein